MLVVTLGGCSSSRGADEEDPDGGIQATSGGPDEPEAPGDNESSPDEGRLDVGDPDGPGEGDECAAIRQDAELVPLPADIVLVVDNSGSMGFEAGEVQARLNDFSAQIIDSGIDVRVVLVSSYPGDGNGICIDAPLGSGACPADDDNPPTFTHVDERVGSDESWPALLGTHAQWASAIRPEAAKHVVVITDDSPDLTSGEFDAQFRALDPALEAYVHHSVVPHSDCNSAAGLGTEYIALSDLTGGVAADLCAQDFQAVFDALTTEVVGGSALACDFEIPPPPDGVDFDPDEVNVEFDDGAGNVRDIGRVDSEQACAAVQDGWFYDDPSTPSRIVVCPQTCERMQQALEGSVSIAFGCASIPAG